MTQDQSILEILAAILLRCDLGRIVPYQAPALAGEIIAVEARQSADPMRRPGKSGRASLRGD